MFARRLGCQSSRAIRVAVETREAHQRPCRPDADAISLQRSARLCTYATLKLPNEVDYATKNLQLLLINPVWNDLSACGRGWLDPGYSGFRWPCGLINQHVHVVAACCCCYFQSLIIRRRRRNELGPRSRGLATCCTSRASLSPPRRTDRSQYTTVVSALSGEQLNKGLI